MMKNARMSDKEKIYEIWKQVYITMDRNEMNYYFKDVYDQGKTILSEQDQRIIATIHYQPHVLSLKKKRLCVNYMLGMATIPDYRRRGHMRVLMDSVMDESKHNFLFTLVKAFHPQLYEKFGFEVVCWHKQYRIPTKSFQGKKDSGVSRSFTAQELKQLYEQFTTHFDGFMIRDIHYYENFIKRSMVGDLRLCVYRNQDDQLTGYAFYRERNKDVEIKEIVYLDSQSLTNLIYFVGNNHEQVHVQVSQKEKLEKIFPLAIPRKIPFLMARLHQKELFNKLYDVNVNSALEAFQLIDKPMYNNEDY